MRTNISWVLSVDVARDLVNHVKPCVYSLSSLSLFLLLCSICFCLNLFELVSKLDPRLGQPSGLLCDSVVEAESLANMVLLLTTSFGAYVAMSGIGAVAIFS